MKRVPRVRTALPREALRAALDAADRGRRVLVATVLRRRGSTPSTPGQKLALIAKDEAIGTIGGGAIELRVLEAMVAAFDDPGATLGVERYELGATMGMCCGGSVEVLIEPMAPAPVVLLVGAGHVATALAPLLSELGFRVVVCDAREDSIATFESVLGLRSLSTLVSAIAADHDEAVVRELVGVATHGVAALVMTHDHQLDQRALEWALGQGYGFVGGVGSRAKAARTRQRLEAKSVPAGEIARVRMPVGVDIGARSPMEIAVAIAGELIVWRNRNSGGIAISDGINSDGVANSGGIAISGGIGKSDGRGLR